MARALLYILLIYLGYQFIFNFLLPVYRTTQQLKKGFREMSERMDPSKGYADKNQDSSSQQTKSEKDQGNNKVGEYIDFEDVK